MHNTPWHACGHTHTHTHNTAHKILEVECQEKCYHNLQDVELAGEIHVKELDCYSVILVSNVYNVMHALYILQ